MKVKEKALEVMQDQQYWSAKRLSLHLQITVNHAGKILESLEKFGSVERTQIAGRSHRLEYRLVPKGSLPKVGRARLFDLYLRGKFD